MGKIGKLIGVGQRNYNFTDRKKYNLKEKLNEQPILVLSGKVAVGKTELVKAFVYENQYEYDQLIWFDAQSYETQQNSLERIWSDLEKTSDDADSTDVVSTSSVDIPTEVMQRLNAVLESNSDQAWLLIIDHLSESAICDDLPLPQPTEDKKQHIILIKRNNVAISNPNIPAPLTVEPFDKEEILALFNTFNPNKSDELTASQKSDILSLAEKIHYDLPGLVLLRNLFFHKNSAPELLKNASDIVTTAAYQWQKQQLSEEHQKSLDNQLLPLAFIAAENVPREWVSGLDSELYQSLCKNGFFSSDPAGKFSRYIKLGAHIHNALFQALRAKDINVQANYYLHALKKLSDKEIGKEAYFLWQQADYQKKSLRDNVLLAAHARILVHHFTYFEKQKAHCSAFKEIAFYVARLYNSMGRYRYVIEDFHPTLQSIRSILSHYQKARDIIEQHVICHSDALEQLVSSSENDQKAMIEVLFSKLSESEYDLYAADILHNQGSVIIRSLHQFLANQNAEKSHAIQRAIECLQVSYKMQEYRIMRHTSDFDEEKQKKLWHTALYSLRNLARAYKKIGNYSETQKVLKSLLINPHGFLEPIQRKRVIHADYGSVLGLMGAYDAADDHLTKALMTFEQQDAHGNYLYYPNDPHKRHYDHAMTLIYRAELYQRKAKFEEKVSEKKGFLEHAEKYLKEAESKLDTNRPSLMKSRIYYRRAEIYEALSHYDSAYQFVLDAAYILDCLYQDTYQPIESAYRENHRALEKRTNKQENTQKTDYFVNAFLHCFLSSLREEIAHFKDEPNKLALGLGIVRGAAKMIPSEVVTSFGGGLKTDILGGVADISDSILAYCQQKNELALNNVEQVQDAVKNNVQSFALITAKMYALQITKLKEASIDTIVNYVVATIIGDMKEGKFMIDSPYGLEKQIRLAMHRNRSQQRLSVEHPRSREEKKWNVYGFFNEVGLKAVTETSAQTPNKDLYFYTRNDDKSEDGHRRYGYAHSRVENPERQEKIIYAGNFSYQRYDTEAQADAANMPASENKCVIA